MLRTKKSTGDLEIPVDRLQEFVSNPEAARQLEAEYPRWKVLGYNSEEDYMRDKKPDHPEAKTLWLISFLLPHDERVHKARVSAWTKEYACHAVQEDNGGAFITACEAVDHAG